MKQFLFFISLIFSVTTVFAQAGHKKPTIGKRQIFGDTTVVKKLERLKDSITNPVLYTDTEQVRIEASRNIDAILQLQKEQKARQKKAAMIRIGIGMALLLVLIIGLSRRRNNK